MLECKVYILINELYQDVALVTDQENMHFLANLLLYVKLYL